MTTKTATNPMFGQFDAVAEALVQAPQTAPPKPDKLEKGPTARQPDSRKPVPPKTIR